MAITSNNLYKKEWSFDIYKKEWSFELSFSWRWKLFIIFNTISVIPLIFFYFLMINATNEYYKRDKETTLLATANIIASSISQSGYFDHPQSLPYTLSQEMAERAKEGNFRVMIIDDMGVVVNDSFASETGRVLVVPEVILAIEYNNRVNTRHQEGSTYAAVAITNTQGENIAALLIVSSIGDILAYADEMRDYFISFIIAVVGILAIAMLVVSKLMLSPLDNFLRVVERASEGHFDQEIHIKGRDEFTKLGNAFNHMIGKLAQSDNSREEFVSNVSHELKTPLSSIKVLTESILLIENVPTQTYNEFLRDINSEIDRMNNIINDLLDLVKLDQRELSLNTRPTDISQMVEDVLHRLTPLAQQKDIEIFYESQNGVQSSVDEMKMSLAVSNIIENGIKYTPHEGMINVTVGIDHLNVYITVTDTGPGISKEDQLKVFDRFYRADKARNRETGGTGLGLAISHQTVLMHGGTIKIASAEGEGSTFVVRLPIRK